MKDESVVEAALFCAGKPIEAEEIAESVGMEMDEVKASLKKLVKDYSSNGGAIEIVKVGRKHVMQLKGEYAERVSLMADTEISKDLLKTAALIAYHQPVMQSSLHKMVGGKAYEHVKELKERNLILTRPKGNSLELSTSKSFPDHFGIDATNRDEIKKWFQEQIQNPQ
ncbi:MAG: SMC-Scp complex subunit ScpB [Thermoplasmata archaeon]|nr:SMC-Scp complex subunit ScpB [Thermoplasmata archaeon]